VFFRLEEIVLASSAAPVDHCFRREYPSDRPVVCLQLDTFGAVGAGVFQFGAVLTVLAVDQQQEVDCSRDAESIIIVRGHRTERKPKPV
jgi:hypothetical protein